jgi:hypothetical protein
VFHILIVKEKNMAYTLDTKVGDILKDPKALTVLGQYAQEANKNPIVQMIIGMSLKDILAFPQVKQAGITEEMVKNVLADVNARMK